MVKTLRNATYILGLTQCLQSFQKGSVLNFQGEDVREGNSPSWFNPVETVQVIRYLQGLLNDSDTRVEAEDIGIITPYRKQV